MNILGFFFNVKSCIKTEDFKSSRFNFLLTHHTKKRDYFYYFEESALDDINDLILILFPKRIPKKIKLKLINCVITYMIFVIVNFEHYPGKRKLKNDYNRIIKTNFEKIARGLNNT
jgi:hypothetical protein